MHQDCKSKKNDRLTTTDGIIKITQRATEETRRATEGKGNVPLTFNFTYGQVFLFDGLHPSLLDYAPFGAVSDIFRLMER
jgi:hypothetical protein